MSNIKYTKELLEPLIKESFSMSEVVRRIGKRTDNGFVTYLTKLAKKFEINYDHFKTRSQQFSEIHTKYSIEDFLSNKIAINSNDLRLKLFKAGLKKELCEECGILDWHGKRLSFHLHHKDENHYNNSLENLIVLCPNCHYCTHNDIRDKRNKEKNITKNKRISKPRLQSRKVERPPFLTLKKEVEESNYCAVGRKYNVSDNTIRKWIKSYEKYGN